MEFNMGTETWYRGSATGVEPAKAGVYVHDFTDGLYLTDRLDVAYNFAGARTTNSDEQLPYVMYGKFDPGSLGRVLDLTQGSHKEAWSQFESRVSPSGGATYRQMMTIGGGNYGRLFKAFLEENKIDINAYDIVIGPLYTLGGRQMCIRNPSVASRVEGSILTPGAPPKAISPVPAPMTLKLNQPTPGKGQANAGAAVLLFLLADYWLDYFNSSFQTEQANQGLKMELKKIRQWQRDTPTDGALVAVTFSRTVPNSVVMRNVTLIHAGDQFEYASTYFAPTPEQAAELMRREPFARRDIPDGPYTLVWHSQLAWIEPRLRKVPDPAPLTSPVGRWRVQVSKWTWNYEFDSAGRVRWTDPFNGMTGNGTWKIANGKLLTSWAPVSKTVEQWDLPLDRSNQTGKCFMQVGTFLLSAAKI